MRRILLALGLLALLAGCGQASSPGAAPASARLEPAQHRATASAESAPSGGGSAQAAGAQASAPASGQPDSSAQSAAQAAADPGAQAGPSGSAPPAAASPRPSPTAVPKVQLATIPPAKRIGPLIFISQTLNNCGPASIAEILNYFGIRRSQAEVAAVLRPDLPAYGMSLYGVPFYAESVGMRAAGGIAGTDELIKAFVANGLPVIVADQVSRTDATRHFRPIDGYDDQEGWFIGSDPYLGPNHKIAYADFDDLWRISTNRWVVIYPPAKQDLVDAILARYWSRDAAVQAGLQRANQRMAQQPWLPWTWLELADLLGDLKSAGENIQKGSALGLPFEAHWLQMKLQRASSRAA
jgi:predicted double-glycine peptidase